MAPAHGSPKLLHDPPDWLPEGSRSYGGSRVASVKLIRLRLTAGAGLVLVMILSACSDGGDPADSEMPVPNSADSETPDEAGSETPVPDGADAQDDSTTERKRHEPMAGVSVAR